MMPIADNMCFLLFSLRSPSQTSFIATQQIRRSRPAKYIVEKENSENQLITEGLATDKDKKLHLKIDNDNPSIIFDDLLTIYSLITKTFQLNLQFFNK